jgi:hypothetical protein
MQIQPYYNWKYLLFKNNNLDAVKQSFKYK